MHSQHLVLFLQRQKEDACLEDGKIRALQEQQSQGCIILVSGSDLTEAVVHERIKWYDQFLWNSFGGRNQSLVDSHVKTNDIVQIGARTRPIIHDGKAISVNHVNADDVADEYMVGLCSHLGEGHLQRQTRECTQRDRCCQQQKKASHQASDHFMTPMNI